MPVDPETVTTIAALVAFGAASIALSIVDLREHRLPNRMVAATALACLSFFLASSFLTADWSRFITAVTAAFVYFSVFLMFLWVASGALGAGDVKIAPVIGAVAGWVSPVTAMIWVPLGFALSGAILVFFARAQGVSRFAFGPAMFLGCWVGIAWSLWIT